MFQLEIVLLWYCHGNTSTDLVGRSGLGTGIPTAGWGTSPGMSSWSPENWDS